MPVYIYVVATEADKPGNDYLRDLQIPNPSPVGGRLQQFWKVWENKGASPYVVDLLKEGLKLDFHQPPPIIKNTYLYGLLQRGPNKKAGAKSGGRGTTSKERSRISPRSKFPRVLWETLFETKARRSLAVYNRPVGAQQIHHQPVIPDGDGRVHPKLNEAGNVGHIHRLKRRLLPHSCKQKVPEIHEDRPFWPNSTVQGDAHGSERLGSHFHQSNGRDSENHENRIYSSQRVHRRLDFSQFCKSSTQRANCMGRPSDHRNGVDHQSSQVGALAKADHTILRGPLQLHHGKSICPPGKNRSPRITSTSHPEGQRGKCKTMGSSARSDGIDGQPNSAGGSPSQTFSAFHASQLGPKISEVGEVSNITKRSRGTSPLVVRQSKHTARCASKAIQTESVSIHGCQPDGFRCHTEQLSFQGQLESRGTDPSHKQSRTASNHKICKTLPGSSEKPGSIILHRQFNNSSLIQQTGGDQVMGVDDHGMGTVDPPGLPELQSESTAHTREIECGGGHAVERPPGSEHRMDDEPNNPQQNLGSLGKTASGPICELPEPQAASLCISFPRPESLENQCPSHPMDGSKNVRIPPVVNSGRGSTKIAGRTHRDDSHCSSVDKPPLVSPSETNVNGRAHQTPSDTRSSVPAPHRRTAPKSRVPKSSRLETVQRGIQGKGFSDKVATRIAKNVRTSTNNIYQSKWDVFCDWCNSQGIAEPANINIGKLADFFLWLFEVKNLELNTIKGYRSALSAPLNLANKFDLSANPMISALFSNFAHERPAKTKEFPKWDLSSVLDHLRKPPYEPISKATPAALNKKTAFLLLLASGARRGEIHAIDHALTSYHSNGAVTLKPNPKFMAKNFNVNTGEGAFKGFSINPLVNYLGADMTEDLKNCPIRALKVYSKKTKHLRDKYGQLFINCSKEGHFNKPAGKNAISSWIKQLVAEAHDGAIRDSISLNRPAHEVRAIASSLCLYNNTSLESILEQCRWKKQTTFTSYYLRDMSKCEGLLRLGPLMAAGTVMTTNPRPTRR